MQHINFFKELEPAAEVPFSARQQSLLLAALLVILLMTYFVVLWQQSALDETVTDVRADQQALTASIDILMARKKTQENNAVLLSEIAILESGVKFRRQLLVSINPKDQQGEKGFSVHLKGLARQQLEGVWFTHISLTHRGEQMALQGYTKKPEYLPRYLQKLSAEPIFEGQQFSVLRMAEAEKYRNAMRFDVRTREKESAQ
jgi:Fimbrial assembly protein (PilN)